MNRHHQENIEYADATRFSLTPGHHKVADLARKLTDHIKYIDIANFNYNDQSPSNEAYKTLRRMAANQAVNGDQHFRLDNFTEPDYAIFLNKLFQIFNTIFFMDLLPPAKVFEKKFRTAAVPAAEIDLFTPPATLTIFGASSIFRGHKAEIALNGLGRSWHHIGALLGAMIELFLRHFGCSCKRCRYDKEGYGNEGYGEAWQHIAFALEYSPVLYAKISHEFFRGAQDLGFYRRELYVYELSSWEVPFMRITDTKLWRDWGWDEDCSRLMNLVYMEQHRRKGKDA